MGKKIRGSMKDNLKLNPVSVSFDEADRKRRVGERLEKHQKYRTIYESHTGERSFVLNSSKDRFGSAWNWSVRFAFCPGVHALFHLTDEDDDDDDDVRDDFKVVTLSPTNRANLKRRK
ncbi:hypothetical protein RUM44_009920 [Polyplax serrata]|uniref:Uncharacterized protein n=1 Tax=Polyplax serrata TaxID=468196 RepID=A0ABR1AVK1_POLSC